MSSENTVLEQQNTPQTAPTTEDTQPASTSLLQTASAPAAAEDNTEQTERPNWLPEKLNSV